MSARLITAFLTALVLTTAQVHAQEGPSLLEEQQRLNQQALAAAGGGQYGEALELLQSSLALGELNVTWLNLGRIYFLKGHCREASEAYARVGGAPTVVKPSPEAIQGILREYLSELTETCPGTLTFECTPLNLKLLINGNPHTCQDAVELPAGRHIVAASLDEARVEVSIDVEAASEHVVNLTLPVGSPVDEGSGLRLTGWVLSSAGLLAALTGVVLRIQVEDDLDEITAISKDPLGDLDAYNALRDDIEAQAMGIYITFGVSAALLATGSIFLLAGSADESDESALQWGLDPGGIWVRQRF